MRILVIEDSQVMSQCIQLTLRAEGFNVFVTDQGEEGIELGKHDDYDAIILDLGLPDISGYDVLKTIRRAKVKTPVLILSGTVTVDAKVKAFTAGADDYMTKPFHKDELAARLRAMVRRSKGHPQSLITTGQLTINLDAKSVEIDGKPLNVTSREYQMLELLALRKGSTLTKQMFMDYLYGGMDEPEAKIIDVFICKLRKKIAEACNGENYIRTVWGRGYALGAPELREAA
jgi:two-component system cell cycle response regulator CtrA